MPSFSWYINRLRTMTPQELGWRARDAGRDLVDRWRFASGRVPALPPSAGETPAPFRLLDTPVGVWREAGPAGTDWRERLVRYADELASDRLTFFNLVARHAGTPIDWNRDLETGRATPMSFAPAIDYRDPNRSGDAKVVWEPSRHQHLVTLARAYRATGDERYAKAVVAQIESWLDQSPFGYGMNWRSPLELGIRLINWVWALDLIRESGTWSGPVGARIRQAVYLHVWEISRKYSRGSSSNNHLIGEAAGVFVATAYFQDLPDAKRLRDESRAILIREVFAQTHPDGGSREQAPGYQVFVLQFYLAVGVIARKLGDDLPPECWARLEKMMEFLAALTEAGTLPMIGDGDDGYVLDLGARGEPASVLSAGAVLFGRADFAASAGGVGEWAYWLLGPGSLSVIRPGRRALLASRAFPESGYYLLQGGTAGEPDGVSVVYDCAELGFGALAAHGHADALSIVVRVGGEDLLVDPGTYDYFTYPEWRRYLRSTPAHNTVTVDAQDQSLMTGPFMWGTRAESTLLEWSPSLHGGVVRGEHDGYERLADPVVHRRRVELDSGARRVTVTDEIACQGRHDVEICFQFSEHCRVSQVGTVLDVDLNGRAVSVRLDPALDVTVVPRSDRPEAGWVSRGYHVRAAAPRVVARGLTTGSSTYVTTLHY